MPIASDNDRNYQLTRYEDYWLIRFRAMASPCEVLVDSGGREQATLAADIAVAEAQRIEQKFSRYRSDNIVHAINHSQGKPVEVDAETGLLLDYAKLCYELSEGLFDITSGVLREAWRFDGSDRLPAPETVDQVVQRVGWHKVHWQQPVVQLQPGMEIDFGGIGKEYAVDRTALLLAQAGCEHVLVNYGGDLVAVGSRKDGQAWTVGIDRPGGEPETAKRLRLERGALTTSGDTHRFLLKDGMRYSHILDPRTGWPVPNAPHTVTVHAQTCLEAGMLATFAMLQGDKAEAFLEKQNVRFWIQR